MAHRADLSPESGIQLPVSTAISLLRTLLIGTVIAVTATVGSYYSISTKLDRVIEVAAELKADNVNIHRSLDPLVYSHSSVSAVAPSQPYPPSTP